MVAPYSELVVGAKLGSMARSSRTRSHSPAANARVGISVRPSSVARMLADGSDGLATMASAP